jgi:hypothetical protein
LSWQWTTAIRLDADHDRVQADERLEQTYLEFIVFKSHMADPTVISIARVSGALTIPISPKVRYAL